MSRYFNDRDEPKFALFRDIIAFILLLIILMMYGCPQYMVWTNTLEGKGALKKAEWDRQITIQEAQAKEIAAQSWAKAEVTRAKGSAEANEIMRVSFEGKGSDQYLRWLFIDKLPELKGQVFYIPTETGMPILEAGKR